MSGVLAHRLLPAFAICAALAVRAAVAAAADDGWRPRERWRGFNLLNMFIKGSRPDPAPGEAATGFCYRNPQEFPESDFRMIAGWGFNFARLPLDYRYWTKGCDWAEIDDRAVSFLDRAIERGRRWGVHVQLCFHRAPGYSVARPAESRDLFTDEEAQRVCAMHWAHFARRYRGIPNDALSFNILNEPPDRISADDYANVARRLIEAIRAEDPERYIVVDGAAWATRPVKALEGLHNVGFSLHAYFPSNEIAADSWPPASPDMPQGAIAAKGKEGWYAPIELHGLENCRMRLRVGMTSGDCVIAVARDGETIARFALSPDAESPDWKNVVHLKQWNVTQGRYTGEPLLAKIDGGANVLSISLESGDWVEPLSITLEDDFGRKAALPFALGRLSQPLNLRQRFVRWGENAFKSLDPAPGGRRFAETGRETVWRNCLSPWKDAVAALPGGVMAGEFGPMLHGDAKASYALVADMLAVFKDAGIGWCLWGLYGECGVLDAPRDGAVQERYGGHLLDRRMLELLQNDGEVSRTLEMTERWLTFPATNAVGPVVARFRAVDAADGRLLRTFAMPVAHGRPVWTAAFDAAEWRGRKVKFILDNPGTVGIDALEGIALSREEPREENLRREPTRLQFHFTPPRGWMNDPNGLVYADGEWRLFYQHCPFTALSPWDSNMFWGYATSPDLVHWTDCGDAVLPQPESRLLISGCGVIDRENTAGFGSGAHVVAAVQGGLRLWFSHDGRAFEPFSGNPVFCGPDLGADPKIKWYAPERKWIMVTHGVKDDYFAVFFHSSKDLKNWNVESCYKGDPVSAGREHFLHECPGLEELKIEGENATAWVVWGAGPEYAVGDFDGKTFVPREERLMQLPTRSTPYYAQQSFQNAPDGRCVVIPWYRVPGRAPHFSQAMGLPCDLSLKRTAEGLRICRRVAPEMKALRDGNAVEIEDFEGELAECDFDCEIADGAQIAWNMRGIVLRYDAAKMTISVDGGESVRWAAPEGRLAFKAFVDRGGLEVFSSDGLQTMAWPYVVPDAKSRSISVKSGKGAKRIGYKAYRLKSIWGEE